MYRCSNYYQFESLSPHSNTMVFYGPIKHRSPLKRLNQRSIDQLSCHLEKY